MSEAERDPSVRPDVSEIREQAAAGEPQAAEGAPEQAAGEAPQRPSPSGEPPASGLVEPPEQAVERLSAELESLRDRHLRLAAEFDNFRKRMQRERGEIWSRAQAAVVASLLEVLDDLGRVVALDAAKASLGDVLQGVSLVERKLVRALESAGLERVGASGEVFDPNVHEAVGTSQAGSPEQDRMVAEVLQPGYRFAGFLLRPARVSVYVWSGHPSGDGGGGE